MNVDHSRKRFHMEIEKIKSLSSENVNWIILLSEILWTKLWQGTFCLLKLNCKKRFDIRASIWAWRKLMKRLLPLLLIHPPCWFMSEVHFAASMSNVRKVLGCLVTAGLNPALNGYHAVSGHVESLSRGVNENLTLHRIRICSFYFLKDHLTTFTFIQLTDWYYDISRDCVKTILSRLRVKTIFGPTIICSCHVPDLYLRPTSTLFVFCKTSLSLDLPLIMIVASPNQLN